MEKTNSDFSLGENKDIEISGLKMVDKNLYEIKKKKDSKSFIMSEDDNEDSDFKWEPKSGPLIKITLLF